jgi:4-amino-4-deoxy-L-arabinose transferase-like glycosyltransferase
MCAGGGWRVLSVRTGESRHAPARLWIIIALAAPWFALMGERPLFNPDEGRYAEIPREMLASGNWLVPHLNNLVYIEKPPLQYWATALAYELFGTHVWAARLYTGLCGLFTVLVTAALARRLWGSAVARRAAIMLATSFAVLVMSQQLTLDMSLTFFMTLTLAAFCVAQDAATSAVGRRQWMWLAWACAAAAFLTKGLVALVLPAFALGAYSLLYRHWKPWRRLSLVTGLAVFMLIALPWCVLMQRHVPQFFDFFFVREHFQRFLTTIEDRYEPPWFFIPVLAVGSLPWLLPAGRALASGWRVSRTPSEFDARAFLWVWCVIVFVFFSMSDSKLIPYILPLFPALALLMASAQAEERRRDLKRTGLGLVMTGVLLAVAAGLLPRFLPDPVRAPFFIQLRLPILLMGLICIGGGFLARGKVEATATVGMTAYLCVFVLLLSAHVVAPLYSGATLAAQLSPAIMAGTPIYSVRTYDQSLPFYLGRTMTLVETRGELDFGLTLEPDKTLDSLEAFRARWLSASDALAVVAPDTYSLLQQQGLPMVVRARVPERLIVSRR